jgi:hypothetical protein
VTSGAEANLDMTGTIVYQTDSGTVYGVVAGTIAAIGMFELGSYLIRAKATFAEGKIGYVNVNAVTAGPCTLYNWDDNETFQAASIPDTTGGTDMGKYGGLTVWQQVCVVNNLSSPTTSYINFTNQTTLSLTSVVGYLQILRLT